ncbi:DNA polymerase epsilon subunit 1 [Pancytospora philotis]|nr:DNA polymerase epsilon subunit 1 [Pancytospora philotis]
MDENFESTAQLAGQFGYTQFFDERPRAGWLLNYDVVRNEQTQLFVDMYFVDEDARNFTIRVPFYLSFLVECAEDPSPVEEFFERRYEGLIQRVQPTSRIDVGEHNHLNRPPKAFLKVSVKREADFQQIVREMGRVAKTEDDMYRGFCAEDAPAQHRIYEHDIPNEVQVGNELGVRCGAWYCVSYNGERYTIEPNARVTYPDLRILAYDIETTKPALKFPNPEHDEVMMISIMTESFGELITNRTVVSRDIMEFEYTAKDDMRCTFRVANEENEEALLVRFVEAVQQHRPHIITTYNGGYFDWPFVEKRAAKYGISLERALSMRATREYYESPFIMHLDCYKWVKRDSYLPMNNQGLKDAARIKLGYFPDEIDPEDMVRCAREEPQKLASYSVSDAVATYYLYTKYVQPHIFSIASIIPLPTVQVLCRGSGTLCEALLLCESIAYQLLVPPKKRFESLEYFKGHIVNNLTYIGGHVESLQAGIYRSDFEHDFRVKDEMIDLIIEELDHLLAPHSSLPEYPAARAGVVAQLNAVRGRCRQKGMIYHLDVGAMYPNIILTNRLQPVSIVNEDICIHCDHNRPESDCKRRMAWVSRAEYLPPTANDIKLIKNQLMGETFYSWESDRARAEADREEPARAEDSDDDAMAGVKRRARGFDRDVSDSARRFDASRSYVRAQPSEPAKKVSYAELPISRQESILRERVTEYSKKIYKRVKKVETKQEELTVCQREVPFYVETIRKFRDQRNVVKRYYKAAVDAYERNPSAENKKKTVVYNSLQIAYKCVLNSFYGYVMRKGSRWFSLEMAAAVCHVGGEVIRLAKEVTDAIGIPLELDTDGIWCLLPAGFPSTVMVGSKKVSLITNILNYFVCQKFTNSQYQILRDGGAYDKVEQNSILFEVDGPYRAMIIPASTEENRLLKKRYVIFNDNGSIAELKGFELKRRGELNIVKKFQEDLFQHFNDGSSLQECYDSIAAVCNYWLDIIHTEGAALSDEVIFDLFSESRYMAKSLDTYGDRKSNIMNTARRMAEFLGKDILEDKLKCEFIISRFPVNAPTAERCIPVLIFRHPQRDEYLRRWLGTGCSDLRRIIDWAYYRTRFDSILQRLVVIPAYLQNIKNPLARVEVPKWITKLNSVGKLGFKRVGDIEDALPKRSLSEVFYSSVGSQAQKENADAEQLVVPAQKECQPVAAPAVESSYSSIGLDALKKIVEAQRENWLAFYRRRRTIVEICMDGQEAYTERYLDGSRAQHEFVQKIFLVLNDAEYFGEYERTKVYLPNSIDPCDAVVMRLGAGMDRNEKYRRFFEHFAIKGVYNTLLDPMYQLIADHDGGRLVAPYATVSSITYQKKSIFCITADVTAFVSNSKIECGVEVQSTSLAAYRARHLYSVPVIVYNSSDPNAEEIAEAFCGALLVPLALKQSIHLEGLEAMLKRQHDLQLRMREEYNSQQDIAELFKMPLRNINDQVLEYAFYKELCRADTLAVQSDAFTQNVIKDESYRPGYFATYTLQIECTNSLLLAIIEHSFLLGSNSLFDGIRRREFVLLYDFLKLILVAALRNNYGAARLVPTIAKWLKKDSRLVSEELRELINILQQKYLINLVHQLKEMQCKVVSASKELITIDTGRTDAEGCAAYFGYIQKKVAQLAGYELLSLQVVRRFERLGFVSPDCYFCIDDGEVLSFASVEMPRSFFGLYFSDAAITNEQVYGLVTGMSHEQARLMLRLLSYKRDVHGLAANCYKLLRLSEFGQEKSHQLNLTIFCPHCGAEALIRKRCVRCYADLENACIEEECGRYLNYLWRMQARGDRHCSVCKAAAELKLRDYCRCGGKIVANDHRDEMLALKQFVDTKKFDESVDAVIEFFK